MGSGAPDPSMRLLSVLYAGIPLTVLALLMLGFLTGVFS